jgi:hypothetical protein
MRGACADRRAHPRIRRQQAADGPSDYALASRPSLIWIKGRIAGRASAVLASVHVPCRQPEWPPYGGRAWRDFAPTRAPSGGDARAWASMSTATSRRTPAMEQGTDLDMLVERLLSDGCLDLGECRLVRNPVCDCVLGTDPLGIETVAAYTACRQGCRQAIAWAQRANATGSAAQPGRAAAPTGPARVAR